MVGQLLVVTCRLSSVVTLDVPLALAPRNIPLILPSPTLFYPLCCLSPYTGWNLQKAQFDRPNSQIIPVRNLSASGRPGVLSILLGAFRLTTRLLVTTITSLVIPSVNLTLRAMTTTAALSLEVRRRTIPSILTATLGLRVSAGLLNSTNVGRTVRVWVTVICRRRLFDNLCGRRLTPLSNLIRRSSPPVLLMYRVPGRPTTCIGAR